MPTPSAPDKDKVRRLRRMLALFFIVLMIPVGALLFFAFQQMEWEVFHQHRQQAEAFVKRVNEEIFRLVERENARPATDYRFIARQQTGGELRFERSELSRSPESLGIPGLVGHFQIEPNGEFSSPLLPDSAIENSASLLNADEAARRKAISRRLQKILTTDTAASRSDIALPAAADIPALVLTEDEVLVKDARQERTSNDAPVAKVFPESAREAPNESLARFDAKANKSYQQNRQRLGSVSELALDDSLEQKSQKNAVAGSASILQAEPEVLVTPQAARRKERAVILKKTAPPPAPEIPAEALRESFDVSDKPVDLFDRDEIPEQKSPSEASPAANQSPDFGLGDQNFPSITSFESEVAQFRLSLFDDEHLVLHRNVWQNGSRLVQGIVLHRQSFIEHFIQNAYFATSLSNMSRLLVAFNDDVLNIFSLPDKNRYISNASHLTGSLLYQGNLIAPFQGFSLILNIVELPLGTSIQFLASVTGVMFVVLLIGFYFIFRYSKKQIALVRQQQDFVSAVSHELKTPLTSIRMYSEMLKNNWADEQKKSTYYDYIHGESERLSRLIENVLQLARINRRQTNQSNSWISVAELLANALSSVSSLTEANGFTVNQHCSQTASGSMMFANADNALQILINLIDNGVKFSRQSTQKKIDLKTDILSNGVLEISVRDYGPGISETQMKKIFELFYRSENELTRETVGTGIGLNLVRELAIGMGATIDVRNCSPGAEFSIRWPAKLVKSVQDQ